MPYSFEVFFAAAVLLLFGIVAPLFLSQTHKLPIIDRLIYAWVGLGGIITISVMMLSLLQLYDFFSVCLTLLLIPLVIKLWHHKASIVGYLSSWEHRTVIWHIRLIEKGSQKPLAFSSGST